MAQDPLLIRGGRVFDPGQGIDFTGSLLVRGGIISRIEEGEIASLPAECEVVPAEGLLVSPGFIDLHCHLRQPGYEDKETIATGTLAAASGGFTTVCGMPNTSPPLDNAKVIEFVMKEAETNGAVRVLPVGCITAGRAGKQLSDMDGLAKVGAVGFSDDGDSVMDTGLLLRAMRKAREFGLPVMEHCEHAALVGGGVMNRGVVSAEMILPGIPASSEEIIVARDIALARLTGARLHICHVSTAGSVEIIREAKSRGVRVTAEVTPHHLTLTEEKVRERGAMAKVNPPLRTEEDRLALIQGLKDGVIDAIATDHAPHTEQEKAAGITEAPFGISGLETALGSMMALVHSGEITLELLITKLTSGPASLPGKKAGGAGVLKKGAPADIVVIDTARSWRVDAKQFASKGKNTPLDGDTLKGKVMATVCRGEIVYRDEKLKSGEKTDKVRGRE